MGRRRCPRLGAFGRRGSADDAEAPGESLHSGDGGQADEANTVARQRVEDLSAEEPGVEGYLIGGETRSDTVGEAVRSMVVQQARGLQRGQAGVGLPARQTAGHLTVHPGVVLRKVAHLHHGPGEHAVQERR